MFFVFVFVLFFHKMASFFSRPWPDPNSHVLSKIDFGVPLVELFKWLDVRDTFTGFKFLNFRRQETDMTRALVLARDCKHPDAMWLTSIFEGKEVSTKEDARKVFLLHENDARALCFAWHLVDEGAREDDLTLLRRSSEMGNAFACSTLTWHVLDENKEELFRLAQLAAKQRERDGFYELGRCFRTAFGCEKDLNLAKENFLMAAELGHVWAADDYGDMLHESDPARWLWWGRAAFRGLPDSFLDSFWQQVEQFFSGSGNATIMFLIGRALKGNIDVEKRLIFGRGYDFGFLISPANQAVSFYDFQIKSARLAIDTWTLIATRLYVIKDMRIYIGKMIWESRFEANYAFDLDLIGLMYDDDDDDDLSSSSSSSSSGCWSSASSSAASSPIKKRSRK